MTIIRSLNIPLYTVLKKYIESNPLPFHMPGHKMGRAIPSELLNDIIKLDVTEIPGTDNLHHPNGAIRDAQELAAKAFSADRTFFVVNGSTCGIHAMIMTACKPGDRIIVARDCHKSVINGIMLAGAVPVYIKPEYNSFYGITTVLVPEMVEKAFADNPDAVGIIITRPNYYGVCSDIVKLVDIAHKYNKLLLVDEAHGAHFAFSEKLPLSAMDAGADICVQSAHKTLPALTQGAYLHVKGNRIDIDRLAYNLGVLQTSSPSYILMTFLDTARALMETDGRMLLEKLIYECRRFRMSVCDIDGLSSLNGNDIINGVLDETRLVVNVRRLGLTGYEFESLLREKYCIQAEMSDIFNTVFIATVADGKNEFDRLEDAVKGLLKNSRIKAAQKAVPEFNLELPEMKTDMAYAVRCSGKEVKLSEAAGRVSCGMIVPYPPGIPVVCPGEVISSEIVEYIRLVIDCGGNVNGIADEHKVRVL